MTVSEGNKVLYGVDDLDSQIDSIIEALNLKKQYFEVKLIMFEAVTNAFIHGNKRDKNKPISLKWNSKDNLLRIYVTDCGSGFKDLPIYKKIDEDDILEEGGRGLYLINSYTDQVEFKNSSIIMKKHIS